MGDEKTEKVDWKLPVAIVAGVVLLWGFSWWWLAGDANRGTFGDMFGGVNALFSGLAFAGVIYAILLQRTELSLQRKELELTRSELKGQKEEMRLQNDTLLVQRFENTFFQLLSLHSSTVESMDIRSGGDVTVSGRDCFKTFFRRLANNYIDRVGTDIEAINMAAYPEFFEKHQSDLGHYFRSLYHIVKFVDKSSVENKKFYTNLVRAQLSSDELSLLFYNCLSGLGSDKFKPLIEKYALLKNMSFNALAAKEHKDLYQKSAFG